MIIKHKKTNSKSQKHKFFFLLENSKTQIFFFIRKLKNTKFSFLIEISKTQKFVIVKNKHFILCLLKKGVGLKHIFFAGKTHNHYHKTHKKIKTLFFPFINAN